jgi:cell division protein FtsX
MRAILTTIFVVLVIVIGFGFYEGWFSVEAEHNQSANSDEVNIRLKANKEKIRDDVQTAKKETQEAIGDSKEQLKKLTGDSGQATGENPQTKTLEGTVDEVLADQQAVKITTDDGQSQVLQIDDQTKIQFSGSVAELKGLQPGDHVKITYVPQADKMIAREVDVTRKVR